LPSTETISILNTLGDIFSQCGKKK